MHYERISVGAPIRQVRIKRAPTAPTKSPETVAAEQAAARQQETAALHAVAQSIVDAIGEHEARRQQSLKEFQTLAIELAIAAASHVVGQAIDQGQFAADALVQQATDRLGLGRPLVASLHPADLDLLRRRLADSNPEWMRSVGLKADAAVPRGGCRIDGDEGLALLSRVEDRLAEIRQTWLEGLDDAQTERRRHADGDQPLRRFPDRRDTA